MAKLVLAAENFAFGPIGKLLDVADLLKEQTHELVFAGFGTSLELARNFPFNKIHEIDTDNPNSNSALESVISQADMLISSMDIQSILVAKKLGKLTTWIDCLFWFWDSIPDQVLDVDLFIRERLIEDSENEKKFGPRIKNLLSVGPIIGRIENTIKKHQALISYGGAEAPYWYKAGRDTNYPFIMTNILQKNIDWTLFDRIIVATNERVAKELTDRFKNTPFEFACLPHDTFIKELSQSEIILITPGLVTAELSFASKTPTIFLPPSNNSQYLQLDEFRKYGLAPASVHLSDFMTKLDLRGMPLRDSTKEVLKQLSEFEQSQLIQTQVGTSINNLMLTRKKWSDEFISNSSKFLDSLGGNGTPATVKSINQLLTVNKIK